MLVLTRRIGQSILIMDNQIRLTVLKAKPQQVKLGIKAPQSIPVDRQEVYLRKQAEKLASNNLPISIKTKE